MLLRKTSSGTRRPYRGAFTLLEILIVVAIIVLLAGVSVTVAYNYYENSQVNVAKTKAKTLATAVNAFHMDQQDWPSSLQELTESRNGFKPYAAPGDILDPWKQPYQMAFSEDGNVEVFTQHNGSKISSR